MDEVLIAILPVNVVVVVLANGSGKCQRMNGKSSFATCLQLFVPVADDIAAGHFISYNELIIYIIV
jgi:hypothetical protein